MQSSYAVTCTNCGGVSTIDNTNQISAQDLICKYCGAALTLPEQAKVRPPSMEALRGGYHQPQIVVATSRPIVVSPTVATTKSKGTGLLSCLVILGIIVASFAAPVLLAGKSIKDAFSSIQDQVNDITGASDGKTVNVRRSFSGMDFGPDTLVYSPDGSKIVGGSSSTIIIWDVQSGTKLAEIEQTFTSDMTVFTADGTQLISNDGGSIVFYAVNDGHIVNQYDARMRTFAMSPDGSMLVFNNYEDEVVLWSVASHSVIRRMDPVDFYITHWLFSPDGQYVVASGNDSKLAAWNVSTGTKFFEGASNATSTDLIAFQPNHNTLVVARDDGLEFYEVENNAFSFIRSVTVKEDFFSIQGFAFSPDGSEIAMGNFFNDISVWNVDDERITFTLKSEAGIGAVAYSPDGRFVIGSATWGEINEWQLRDEPLQGVAVPATIASTPASPTPAPTLASGRDNSAPAQVNCVIDPTGASANIRSGPGTDYGVSGKLTGQGNAAGQQTDASGHTWYRLSDGRGWVRDDVVDEIGECNQLPVE
jgi:WD40 repeat protein